MRRLVNSVIEGEGAALARRRQTDSCLSLITISMYVFLFVGKFMSNIRIRNSFRMRVVCYDCVDNEFVR